MDNPLDWKSAVDPATGRTYWYHRKTRVSTWSKPDALKEVETKSVNPPAISSNQQAHQQKPQPKNTNSSAPSQSFERLEDGGFRFHATFTVADHSSLTKIYRSLHQQQTLNELLQKREILLASDIIEFLYRSSDQHSNVLALQCLWKLTSDDQLIQQLSQSTSSKPVWLHLANFVSRLPSGCSFSVLLSSLVVCNFSRNDSTAATITPDFIVPFFNAQFACLQGMLSNDIKQNNFKHFSADESGIALNEVTLSGLLVLVRKGHLLPAVSLLTIIVQCIRVEKFVSTLVAHDVLPYLHMICLNKSFPNELSALAVSCLKLLVSTSVYLRDRLIEGYLGLASDTNTFPTPIVHPANQHLEDDEEGNDLLHKLDESRTQKRNECSYLSDHLSLVESDDSNTMKRDIEWIPTSGTSWRLPSSLLWTRCPALRDLINDFWAHGGESLELSIDASEEVVANVCHFIHTGMVILPTSFANQCEMLRVSTQLQMTSMQSQLEISLMANISLDNAMILLEFCEHFQYISLAERCIAMIELAHNEGGASSPRLGMDIGYQNVLDSQGKRATEDVNVSLKNAIAESLQDVNELLKSSAASASSIPVSSTSSSSTRMPPSNPRMREKEYASNIIENAAFDLVSAEEDEDFHGQSLQGLAMSSINVAKPLKSGGIYTLLLQQNQPAGTSAAIDLDEDDHFVDEAAAKKIQQPGSARKPSVAVAAASGSNVGKKLTTPNGAVVREFQREMSLQPPKHKTEAEKRWEEMSKPRHLRKPVVKDKLAKDKDVDKEGRDEETSEEQDNAITSQQSSNAASVTPANNGAGKARTGAVGTDSTTSSSANNGTTLNKKKSTPTPAVGNKPIKNTSSGTVPSVKPSSLNSTQSFELSEEALRNSSNYDSNEEEISATTQGKASAANNTNIGDNSAVRSSLALLKTKRSLGSTSRLATLNQKLATGAIPRSYNDNLGSNSSGSAKPVVDSSSYNVRSSRDSQNSDYFEGSAGEGGDMSDEDQLYQHHLPASSSKRGQQMELRRQGNEIASSSNNSNNNRPSSSASLRTAEVVPSARFSKQSSSNDFYGGQEHDSESRYEAAQWEKRGNQMTHVEEDDPDVVDEDYDEGVDYDANSSLNLLPCPDCQRCFAPESLQKHVKICKKVFASRRRVFDSSKKRVEGIPELKTILEQQKKSKGRNIKAESAKSEKASRWKEQSNQFREAMRAAREYAQAKESGNLQAYLKENPPATKEPYIDPSLKQCPNCLRRFNEKAAERHFPICKDIKAQPTMLKKGTGGNATTTMKPRR